jgi:RsiW-degrading membrane proteinase PrsW (M82 family)
MSTRLKWLVTLWGLALLLPGLMALFVYCCLVSSMLRMFAEDDPQTLVIGVVLTAFFVVTVGGGGVTYYHGLHSVAGDPSPLVRLPPLWALAATFPLLVALGLGAQQSSQGALVVFPVPLIAVCVLPPVGILAWMIDGQPGTLTWRRATVAFVAGATVCVVVALVAELLLLGLAGFALGRVGELVPALGVLEEAKRALAYPRFLVTLVALAVVAPLVEEMVKPLVTLPLLPHLKSPREALLLGAVAGAGFAAMENVIYLMVGMPIWAVVLALRALGAALHPLTSGLVTVGWFGVMRREPGAGPKWLEGYGQAVGIHALWNGGSVLLLSLGGVGLLGGPLPDLGALRVTVVGGALALLALEGVLAFVAARVVARREVTPSGRQVLEQALGELSKDQTMAVWAVACVVTLLPVGLAVLEAVR